MATWLLHELAEATVGRVGFARLDEPVQSWFTGHRTPWLTRVMSGVSQLASVPGVVIAVALLFVTVPRSSRGRSLAVLGIAIAGASTVSSTLKATFERTRPPAEDAAGPFAGYAFPSGHVTTAVTLFTVTAVLVTSGRAGRARASALAVAFVLTTMVGLSRAYLGAHWFTDLLGAVLAGGAWTAVVLTLRRELLTRLHERGQSPAVPGPPAPSGPA